MGMGRGGIRMQRKLIKIYVWREKDNTSFAVNEIAQGQYPDKIRTKISAKCCSGNANQRRGQKEKPIRDKKKINKRDEKRKGKGNQLYQYHLFFFYCIDTLPDNIK